jgi:hypothetical protein
MAIPEPVVDLPPLPALLWPRRPLMTFPWNNQLLWIFLRIQVNVLKRKLHQGTGPMEDVSDLGRISTAGTFLTG